MFTVGHGNINDRRLSARWPVGLRLEGWIEPDSYEGPAIPITLIDFGPGGVGVILQASSAPDLGHCGQLITQSHGGGCSSKPVCCRSLRAHPLIPELWCAGYSFE
jgi:hypothetical protein